MPEASTQTNPVVKKLVRVPRPGEVFARHVPSVFDMYPLHLDPFMVHVVGEAALPPAPVAVPVPAPANVSGQGVCPLCGKTYKQLAQHITKSHNKYVVRIVGESAYMSFNDGPEKEGDMPFGNDERYEWLFYPDGPEGTETIGVVRVKKTGKTSVWREVKGGERKYLYNIKIVG
jgi:hypothetical protein